MSVTAKRVGEKLTGGVEDASHAGFDGGKFEPTIWLLIVVTGNVKRITFDFDNAVADVGCVTSVEAYDVGDVEFLASVRFEKEHATRIENRSHAASRGDKTDCARGLHGKSTKACDTLGLLNSKGRTSSRCLVLSRAFGARSKHQKPKEQK